MQMIPVEQVLEVSSEHPDHRAFSLVTGFGQWKTEFAGEEKAELTLKLSQLEKISRIEVANESSAWLDIRVCREGTPFVALLPTLCLQSRKESKDGENARVRRTLEVNDFNDSLRDEKFDHIKITCRQPFNRSVQFGLSYLKFFTYAPPEADGKGSSATSSGKNRTPAQAAVAEDVVLEIVRDSAAGGDPAAGNAVAASAIKNATISAVARDKRFVYTPLNDGESALSPNGDTLRAKSVLLRSHLTDPKNAEWAPSPSGTAVKASFVFAPKTSAAEQEARAKAAAVAADEVIPGRSPKKGSRQSTTPGTASSSRGGATNDGQAVPSASANLTDDPEGDVDRTFLKDSLSKWRQGKPLKTSADISDNPTDLNLSKVIASSGDTRKPQNSPRFSLVVNRIRQETSPAARSTDSEHDLRPDKEEIAIRVPPPKVRSSFPTDDVGKAGASKRSTARVAKRRSVAEPLARGGLNVHFDSVQAPAAKKTKRTSNILDRIFSSSEDESDPRPALRSNNNSNSHSRENDNPNGGTTHSLVPTPGKSVRSGDRNRASANNNNDDNDGDSPATGQTHPSTQSEPLEQETPKRRTGKSFTKNNIRPRTNAADAESPSATHPGGYPKNRARKNSFSDEPNVAAVSRSQADAEPTAVNDTDNMDTVPIIKPEVPSDGEDMPVVIKQEVIDLDDSDDAAEVVSSTKPGKQAKQFKQNRNPPVSCEVESDSDIEVVGSSLMRGVVFALSGFKNPYRSSLRTMAISMGAKYRPDWDESCTHLVCAFKNTPKYNEVHRKGGRIVTAAWIATSHLKQKLANWENYRLE